MTRHATNCDDPLSRRDKPPRHVVKWGCAGWRRDRPARQLQAPNQLQPSVRSARLTDNTTGPSDPPASPLSPHGRKPARERLDTLLVRRGLAPSRERARALIMAGSVRVNGRAASKAGEQTPEDADLALAEQTPELRYVSRGGLKLERALDVFALDPAGLACLDVGSSTGGFTDVLLRRGARHVYAVDVGHGQLAWSLRSDPRVTVMERTNIRQVKTLPELVGCAVCDVSFISLRLVLPHIAPLLAPAGWAVALVKPQFEAGRAEADRGRGVISDPDTHRRVLRELLAWLAAWPERATDDAPLVARGLTGSPIAGRDGNHEYLLWLARPESSRVASAVGETDIERAVVETLG
jgi:23S rRNA (cytidine1920-2'-O)/16S rRNA (cytidine1409-2'-O)-methyltransferase